MNSVDFIFVLINAGFILFFLRAGLGIAVKSLFSFIFAFFLGSLALDPVLKIITTLGWRENIFTPLIVFTFLIILFWGLLMASLSCLVLPRANSALAKGLTVVAALIYTLVFSFVAYLVVPQFFGQDEIELTQQSYLGGFFDKTKPIKNFTDSYLSALDKRLVAEIMVPHSTTEAVSLNISSGVASVVPEGASFLYREIGGIRRAKGLAPLEINARLEEVAHLYARDILEKRRFSHLDATGRTPEERARDVGYRFNYFGENLALAPTVQEAHQGLMASEGHRQNIESAIFRQIGIAVLRVEGTGVLVVEEFAN